MRLTAPASAIMWKIQSSPPFREAMNFVGDKNAKRAASRVIGTSRRPVMKEEERISGTKLFKASWYLMFWLQTITVLTQSTMAPPIGFGIGSSCRQSCGRLSTVQITGCSCWSRPSEIAVITHVLLFLGKRLSTSGQAQREEGERGILPGPSLLWFVQDQEGWLVVALQEYKVLHMVD